MTLPSMSRPTSWEIGMSFTLLQSVPTARRTAMAMATLQRHPQALHQAW